jgi:hypothetical protein
MGAFTATLIFELAMLIQVIKGEVLNDPHEVGM